MTTHLRRDLDVLHTSLLTGKLPRNLNWDDTVDLIARIGEVRPHGGDEFVFIVGTQQAFFRHPGSHGLGIADVARLRHLLRSAGSDPSPDGVIQPYRMVVVIDHHAAHVYQDYNGNVPKALDTVRPYDPFGFHHHLIHKKEAHYRGERVPEEKSFYEDIAKDLLPANEIVLIGHGTGKSSAVDHLTQYLREDHHDISRRVVASRPRTSLH